MKLEMKNVRVIQTTTIFYILVNVKFCRYIEEFTAIQRNDTTFFAKMS